MTDWNLGSIGTAVHALVPNISSTLSGARLLEIADRKREYVENYTGVAIGSTAITIDHQDIIVNLTASQVVRSQLLSAAGQNVSLGDFSKGSSTSAFSTAAQTFEDAAKEQLKSLGRKVNYYKAWGV